MCIRDSPLTVGGGVRAVADSERLLEAGADKVGINSAAVTRPNLLAEVAGKFGSQCTVLALDAARNKPSESSWEVVVHSGKARTGMSAVSWAREAVDMGAGEILLTSWDRDLRPDCAHRIYGVSSARGGCGHIEQNQFVCPLGLVGRCPLDRVAGVSQALELHTFDDPAVTYVEARDYSGHEHQATPLPRSSQRASSLAPQAPESSGWN